MTITLPDSMRAEIELQARIFGHEGPDCLVEELVRNGLNRIRREIEQKLIEGLQSGNPNEVNKEFWAERRVHLGRNQE